MTTIGFHDRMSGYISFAETDYNQALLDGRRVARRCAFDVDIKIYDIESCPQGSDVVGTAVGRIECEELGGRLAVGQGAFGLFQNQADDRVKRMRYRLFATDADGRKLTLSGFKDVADNPNFDVWSDTTTLLIRLLAGHVSEGDEAAGAAPTVATGVLRIAALRFMRLLASVRATDGSPVQKALARGRLARLFGAELAQVFGGRPLEDHLPDFPDPLFPGRERWHGYPPGEWHQPPELPGLWRRIVGFETEDEWEGTLHNVRADPQRDGTPVLLIHGTGVRANLFYGAPGRASIIPALLDAGFDVWLENWRASIDLPPHPYTLDQAGLYDHPAAIDTVLELTERERLRVLCHCQGSTSFTITYLAGLAGPVERVVSSAVSLHPVVPRLSRLKLTALVPVLGLGTPYLSAQWGARPPTPLARAVARYARLCRRECDDPVCALGNYMYGAGPDVLWRHQNLDPATHHWTSREFGYAPFRFLKQMRTSVLRGHLVPVDGFEELPDSYIDAPLPAETPWTFVAGTKNRLFVHQSQEKTFEHFAERQPDLHALELIEGYGHLDVLFGKDAPADTYPKILAGLGPA